MFQTLRSLRRDGLDQHQTPAVTVGIISNSDPRVSDILTSLGLAVHPNEATTDDGRRSQMSDLSDRDKQAEGADETGRDIDFVVTSYETGFEKPAPGIFAAARSRLELINKDHISNETEPQMLHIGDDVNEDFEGARSAGWKAILIDPRPTSNEAGIASVSGLGDVNTMLRCLNELR